MEQITLDGTATLSQLSPTVQQSPDPLRLSGEGYGDMVVMSAEAYEDFMRDMVIWSKLREAEIQAKYDNRRYTQEEINIYMMNITADRK